MTTYDTSMALRENIRSVLETLAQGRKELLLHADEDIDTILSYVESALTSEDTIRAVNEQTQGIVANGFAIDVIQYALAAIGIHSERYRGRIVDEIDHAATVIDIDKALDEIHPDAQIIHLDRWNIAREWRVMIGWPDEMSKSVYPYRVSSLGVGTTRTEAVLNACARAKEAMSNGQ